MFISEFSCLISAALLWLSSQHQILAGRRANPFSRQRQNRYLGLAPPDKLPRRSRNRGFASADQRFNAASQITFFVKPKIPLNHRSLDRDGMAACRPAGNAAGDFSRSRSISPQLIRHRTSGVQVAATRCRRTTARTLGLGKWIYLAPDRSSGNPSYISCRARR